MNVTGNKVAAHLTRNPDKPSTDFRIIGPASSEQAVEAVRQVFMQGATEFTASFRSFDERKVQVAMLKAGYLAMFQRFGYPLLLRSGLKRIRDIIANRSQLKTDLAGIHGELHVQQGEPKGQILYMTAMADEHKMAMVALRCRLLTTVWRFVLIPLDDDSDEFYLALAEHARQQPESMTVSAKYET